MGGVLLEKWLYECSNRTFFSLKIKDCSGISQGSVIGHLQFLIYINYLPAIITLRFYVCTYDVKLICPFEDKVTIFEDFRQTFTLALM